MYGDYERRNPYESWGAQLLRQQQSSTSALRELTHQQERLRYEAMLKQKDMQIRLLEQKIESLTNQASPDAEKEDTMKNVVAFLRLNKDQRAMRKAGLVDDNGNLTEDGKTVLLNLLLEDKVTEMAQAARDYNKGDKDENKEKDS